jgi:ribosomal RNA-processing protein 36
MHVEDLLFGREVPSVSKGGHIYKHLQFLLYVIFLVLRLTVWLKDDETAAQSKQRIDLSTVSFGDLARAQRLLEEEQDDEASEPKSRSRDYQGSKIGSSTPLPTQSSRPQPKSWPGRQEDEAESSSDEANSGDDNGPAQSKTKAKRSRYAPIEMSSKRPVRRYREVIPVQKRAFRDPRFDPVVAGTASTMAKSLARKNYGFLDEYRASEMKDLKSQIKKVKSQQRKEELQRELMSMQSRQKAREREELEDKILEEHRRKEKELVKEGKKPFYLKKAERKNRLLVEQFKSMKKRQVDKAIERKRKKVAAKEKKELDGLTRRR